MPQPPSSSFSALIDQSIHVAEKFTLECGMTLKKVPVAYKTWGSLNENKDNVMIICHAFTGSADVEDWWGPLIGRGKAFDPSRWFIFCANVLGSPYGTASPVTVDPEMGKQYGPEFPPTTIRDDVRLHKLVLDHLGVQSVSVVIGGSMGGMAVLEWPLCTPPGYVKYIVPLATSARHSAWCISWGEAQRQSIYSDPTYNDGYYQAQPAVGLAAARMSALLTYRSRDSFEKRFGRKSQVDKKSQQQPMQKLVQGTTEEVLLTPPSTPKSTAHEAFVVHNEGHRNASSLRQKTTPSPTHGLLEVVATVSVSDTSMPTSGEGKGVSVGTDVRGTRTSAHISVPPPKPPIFSAQSYLRYQGDKFTARFDANCYIHITRKMDTHDLARGRDHLYLAGLGLEGDRPVQSSDRGMLAPYESTQQLTPSAHLGDDEDGGALGYVLGLEPPRALVISIATDGLFTTTEQEEIAEYIPEAELVVIPSVDGHDGFLLEFEAINGEVMRVLQREFPEVYEGDGRRGGGGGKEGEEGGGFEIKKTSVFGEAEVDITSW
ncbi:homoserine O-acetyltransferase [Pluteus cervinus]|uniref:Homoserine O-acetyltransferase n=1 Tax=Pluteus cervinus TaxID=181527 RepID=A0ACD3ABC8_9AGAR|nr:homoserine O-acetyltransferase [Pluteus cervinus]